MSTPLTADNGAAPAAGRRLRLLAAACALLVAGACAAPTPEASAPAPAGEAAAPPPPPPVPSSAPGGYLAGLHAERLGDLGGAADFLAYALAQDPENLDLLQRTFLLTLGEGDFGEAVKLARRLSERTPDAPLPALTLAVQNFRDGNYLAAEARVAALSGTGLNRFFVPLVSAWVRTARGDTDGAIAALDPLQENSNFAALRDLHAGLLNDAAGRVEAAEENLRAAVSGGAAGSLRVVQALGRHYQRVGAPDRARPLYDEYLAENPDSVLLDEELAALSSGTRPPPLVADAREGLAEALFDVASALQQQGVTLLALGYAHLALALEPDFPVCQLLIAEIFDNQGRAAEAMAAYDRIQASSPVRWVARLRIAVDLDAQDKTEAALAQLEAMAGERPERIDALVTMGDILRSHERFKEAVGAYSRALARVDSFEERHWAVLYARGIAHERSGAWKEAEADFLRALELRPDQPYVLNYLAYSWVEKGVNLEKARTMLERAAELRPNDGFIVDSLGWILFNLGRTDEAVQKLEKAVELEPQDPTINDHLGDAYWKADRRNEARFQWRRALSLKPSPDLIPKIEAKLQRGLAVSRAEDNGG